MNKLITLFLTLFIVIIGNIFYFFGMDEEEIKYGIFDQSQYFQPKYNTEEFYELTGSDFIKFVSKPITNYIFGDFARLEKMSDTQKIVHHWIYLDAKVSFYGFAWYYSGGFGIFVPELIRIFQDIGDKEMSELLMKTYEIYLQDTEYIKNTDFHWDINVFDELDKEYLKIRIQTIKIIEEYIRGNPDQVYFNENKK